MNNNLTAEGATPSDLAAYPREQLIAIILRQQQQITELQTQLQQSDGPPDVMAPPACVAEQTEAVGPAISERLPSQPHLQVHTESGSYMLPLVNSSFWTLGRSADNAIVLPDRWMSRNHAMVQRMDAGEFYLIDFGSHNGSFVNGRRVSVPVSLKHQDLLTFGQTNVSFLAPAPADSLLSTGDMSDKGPATALLHLRRLISVLVVDIRNFTGLTRSLDERLLSEVVGTWFRRAGEIIRENGSWVDKYIGDAVMAVWIHGAKDVRTHEIRQPFLALQALHTMTSQLHLSYPLPFPLKIGAGINTGYAMVGNTGSGDRPDYTALGDTVNAAFRFETSTKHLGLDLAMGLTTYQALQPTQTSAVLPFCRYTVELKGYESTATIYAGSFEDLDIFVKTAS